MDKFPQISLILVKKEYLGRKKIFNDNVFDTFAVKASAANKKMVGRFHRVIFKMTN